MRLRQQESLPERLNRIRAGVLGASDGIVSVSALLFGVAAAQLSWMTLVITAFSATLAGACSMSLGEYVSVSSTVDAEHQAGQPVSVNPITAALASASAFIAGAALPTAALLMTPAAWRLPMTTIAVVAALALCGYVSGRLSEASTLKSVVRVTIGGATALAVTYCAGRLAASA